MTTWVLWFDDQQETIALYQSDDKFQFVGDFPLGEIAAKTGADPVIGFFPTEHVSFVETTLPKTSEKRLRLALPSLVEEAIASNPEDNFYALSEGFAPGEVSVVGVTSIAYLESILHRCLQANIRLSALSPDCFLLPQPFEGLHKMIHGDRIIVRNGGKQGFAIQKQHAVLIMQELEDVIPQEPGIVQGCPFNFLQTQFACKPPKKSLDKAQKIYIALGAVFAVHMITLGILGAVLNHRLEILQAQSLVLYTEVFPGAVKMTSPKSMIERELKNYGAQADSSLTGSLASLSKALAETPTAELVSLEYHQKRLLAHIKLPNMEALDQLTQSLAKTGAQAEQQQVTEEGNTVSVQLGISS